MKGYPIGWPFFAFEVNTLTQNDVAQLSRASALLLFFTDTAQPCLGGADFITIPRKVRRESARISIVN